MGDIAQAGQGVLLTIFLVSGPILAVIMVLVRHILLGEVYGDPASAAVPSGTVPEDQPRTLGPTT